MTENKGWVAKTKSGTEYLHEAGSSDILRVSNDGAANYHNAALRVFARDDLQYSGGRIDFEWLYEQPVVERPEVGKHMYVLTFGDSGWVISTEIVSVEDLP